MYLQSTGRVFLAERSLETLDRYLAQPLPPYTGKTVCTPAELRQVLAQVRAQGYAWVFEEFEEGLTALATPIRDPTGRVVAAVNVFGPDSLLYQATARPGIAGGIVISSELLKNRYKFFLM